MGMRMVRPTVKRMVKLPASQQAMRMARAPE
jgi:hypothetical protein